MTQISTLAPKGPSARTLDFLRDYARSYSPQRHEVRHILVHAEPYATIGTC